MQDRNNTDGTENSEITINLSDVLKAFLNRWFVILLTAVLFAGALFTYTLIAKPQQYEATVMMYVNSKGATSSNPGSVSSSELSASRQLVDTYSVIARRRDTLTAAVEGAVIQMEDGKRISLKSKYAAQGLTLEEVYDYKTLTKNISVGDVDSTEIFSFTVTCGDPDDAVAIANSFMEVFPGEIEQIILGTEARKVQEAKEATPVSRGFVKMTAIGFLAGMVLSMAAVFVLDILVNDTIESESWTNDTFGEKMPLLTVIPDEKSSQEKSKYGYGYQNRVVSDSVKKSDGGAKK